MTGSVHRSRPPQGTAHPAAHQTRFSNRGAGRFFFVLKAFGNGATWTDFPTRRTLTHMPKTPTRVGRPTSRSTTRTSCVSARARKVPLDDEPLTAADLKAIREAEADFVRGDYVTLDVLKADFARDVARRRSQPRRSAQN